MKKPIICFGSKMFGNRKNNELHFFSSSAIFHIICILFIFRLETIGARGCGGGREKGIIREN